MKRIKLDDFEFGMRDHCFHYSEDITLVPGFNGFSLIYQGKKIKSNLNKEAALNAVEKLVIKQKNYESQS